MNECNSLANWMDNVYIGIYFRIKFNLPDHILEFKKELEDLILREKPDLSTLDSIEYSFYELVDIEIIEPFEKKYKHILYSFPLDCTKEEIYIINDNELVVNDRYCIDYGNIIEITPKDIEEMKIKFAQDEDVIKLTEQLDKEDITYTINFGILRK